MQVSDSFWKSKRVLVTGHTGFKGSWLTCWLQELGAEVFGISLPPSTSPSAFETLQLEASCRHHVIDIRDRKNLESAIRQIDPEIVFHMAAQALVRESYSSPIETYETNVMGTAHILLSLNQCPSTRSIVIITTDKCYENKEWSWPYRETDALGGYDPYSSSKACAEILTDSFRRSFFTKKSQVGVASARAGNVIGGGDWSKDRLLPDIVRSIQADSALEIRNPNSVRPWQHVMVPLSGYLLLAEKLWEEPERYSEAFNFAPVNDDCVPVRVLIEYFSKALGKPARFLTPEAGTHPHEAGVLKLDASKARQKLGWTPAWNLAKALEATAQWYRQFYENPELVKKLTLKQIDDFEKSF